MQRKRHTPDFKSKVALEALKGTKTINEIASERGIHATQITQWKKQAQEGLKGVVMLYQLVLGKREKSVTRLTRFPVESYPQYEA